MKQEQIIKAWECCANEGACDECPIDKRHKDDCVCIQHLVQLTISLIRELVEENERLRTELSTRPPKLIITKVTKKERK